MIPVFSPPTRKSLVILPHFLIFSSIFFRHQSVFEEVLDNLVINSVKYFNVYFRGWVKNHLMECQSFMENFETLFDGFLYVALVDYERDCGRGSEVVRTTFHGVSDYMHGGPRVRIPPYTTPVVWVKLSSYEERFFEPFYSSWLDCRSFWKLKTSCDARTTQSATIVIDDGIVSP